MFEQFIEAYGIELLGTLLVAIFGFLGVQAKKLYKNFVDDKTKESVVKSVVKAMEQIYRDLDGRERYQKAKESIVEMLNSKGVKITESEMNILIEASVSEFNMGFNGTEITATTLTEFKEE